MISINTNRRVSKTFVYQILGDVFVDGRINAVLWEYGNPANSLAFFMSPRMRLETINHRVESFANSLYSNARFVRSILSLEDYESTEGEQLNIRPASRREWLAFQNLVTSGKLVSISNTGLTEVTSLETRYAPLMHLRDDEGFNEHLEDLRESRGNNFPQGSRVTIGSTSANLLSVMNVLETFYGFERVREYSTVVDHTRGARFSANMVRDIIHTEESRSITSVYEQAMETVPDRGTGIHEFGDEVRRWTARTSLFEIVDDLAINPSQEDEEEVEEDVLSDAEVETTIERIIKSLAPPLSLIEDLSVDCGNDGVVAIKSDVYNINVARYGAHRAVVTATAMLNNRLVGRE